MRWAPSCPVLSCFQQPSFQEQAAGWPTIITYDNSWQTCLFLQAPFAGAVSSNKLVPAAWAQGRLPASTRNHGPSMSQSYSHQVHASWLAEGLPVQGQCSCWQEAQVGSAPAHDEQRGHCHDSGCRDPVRRPSLPAGQCRRPHSSLQQITQQPRPCQQQSGNTLPHPPWKGSISDTRKLAADMRSALRTCTGEGFRCS